MHQMWRQGYKERFVQTFDKVSKKNYIFVIKFNNNKQNIIYRCHKFGMWQCCYCKIGMSSIEDIRKHLANMHPQKLTYVCQRVTTTSEGPVIFLKTYF